MELQVIFRLEKKYYSLAADRVHQIGEIQKVRDVSGQVPGQRGVIDLKSGILPLYDLRELMGRRSYLEEVRELLETLEARKKDHQDWMTALEDSVNNSTPFTKAKDAKSSAFGQWFGSFQSDNSFLMDLMRDFRMPHERLHAVGNTALCHAGEGQLERAQRLLQETRQGVLKELMDLYDRVSELIQARSGELFVLSNVNNAALAFAVDTVVAVEYLENAKMEEAERQNLPDWVKGVHRSKKFDDLVFEMDITQLFTQAQSSALPNQGGAPHSAA